MKSRIADLLVAVSIQVGLLACLPGLAQGQATLRTDRADYSPGQTVVFSGTSFVAGENVQIVVNYNQLQPQITGIGFDGQAIQTATPAPSMLNATADNSGNFISLYIAQNQDTGQT